MTTRQDIIDFARTLVGTRFHHQGRLPGVGLDCIGVLVATAKHFKLTFHDLAGYSRRPDGITLIRELDRCLTRICPCEAQPGDVLTFWDGAKGVCRHAGIATDKGMIHSWIMAKGVVEHEFDEYWAERLMVVYKFPGIDESRWTGKPFVIPKINTPQPKTPKRGGCGCGEK